MATRERKKTNRTDESTSEREKNDWPIDHRLFWCIVQHRRGRLWPIRRTHGHQFLLIKSFGFSPLLPIIPRARPATPATIVPRPTCSGTRSTLGMFYNPQENGIKCPPLWFVPILVLFPLHPLFFPAIINAHAFNLYYTYIGWSIVPAMRA